MWDFLDKIENIDNSNDKSLEKIDLIIHMGTTAITTEIDRDLIMKMNLEYSKKL